MRNWFLKLTQAMLFALLSLAVSSPLFAQEARPDNATKTEPQDPQRVKAAIRLMRVQPASQTLSDIARRLAPQLPRESQAPFIEGLTNPEFVASFESTLRSAMVKNFTAAELNALADFYAKPVAKSAMEKMGAYMGDIMPFIMAQGQVVMNRLIEQEQKRIDADRAATQAAASGVQSAPATPASAPISAPANVTVLPAPKPASTVGAKP